MSVVRPPATHCFVVPARGGPLTGGTLYNRGLLTALAELARVEVLEFGAPGLDVALAACAFCWVDSLYLDALPGLKRRSAGRVGLIVHYLPSFVRLGRAASLSELSNEERQAVLAADAFLVTSGFMRGALEALAAPKKPIFVVEPCSAAEPSLVTPEVRAELNAVVVGNVTSGKGIESWLRALEAVLVETDGLLVSVVGSLQLEPEYAARCQRLVRESALLKGRVVFLGSLSQPETFALLARSELFVSASRMESYGIALAEACAVGVPILALAAGNAGAHVASEAGGELASSDEQLALACVRLVRDRTALRARLGKARAHARVSTARSWLGAAREFTAHLAKWEK
ncbi:MAG TPA: glycosyltransferase family 4 protein [Polyangiaceae bacterium]|nr:glycosyltransferase family 4 protein [Polyangiaceae bacterium]